MRNELVGNQQQRASANIETVASGASTRRLLRPSTHIVAVCLCLLFFMITAPKSVPSIMLIIGFVVLAVLFWNLLKIVFITTGLQVHMPAKRRRAVLLIATSLPILLLILQSIGQLTLRDVLTIGGVCIIGAFYVGRVRGPRAK